jgi:predicted amidohydrolase YtcJ
MPGRLTARTLKLQMDGALGSRGAALLEPYADEPGTRGLFRLTDAAVRPLLEEALRRGIQVEAHAIGDHANRHTLDLFERAFAKVPRGERAVAEPRWRIEHAQVVHPVDRPRFVSLAVIPSMQPSHAISDLYFAQTRLGPSASRTLTRGAASSNSACRSRAAPMHRWSAASR